MGLCNRMGENGKKKIIVVGAGIAGLTAAYRLQKAGFSVTVLESENRIGGRATTVKKDGYSIDPGASAVLGSYTAYLALAEELGLTRDIHPASQFVGTIKNGTIHYFNTGNVYWSAFTTGLLSWRSKLRLARAFIDVQRAKKRGYITFENMGAAAAIDTETAAQYGIRRLNREIAEYFVEPLVRGMMLANSDSVSKVELFHGLNNIYDVTLYGLQGGVKAFSDALAAHLDVRLQAPVTSVQQVGGGAEVTWQQNGETMNQLADACVLACPLPFAAQIYPEHQALQTLNKGVRYAPCISVSIGTRRKPKNKAYVIQVPRVEHESICYIFAEHNKGVDVAPVGCGLITAYFSDTASQRWFGRPDQEIVAEVLSFFDEFMPELEGSIELTHVHRWQASLCQNEVGAYQAVNDFRTKLSPRESVQFAGDYLFSAVGQGIAVESGNRAAENILSQPD